MGRRHGDEETRPNRIRRDDGRNYGRGEQGYGRRDYDEWGGHRQQARYGPYYDREGARFYEDDYGRRFYDEDYADRDYYRDRDREREYYQRDREQRQETRRTGMMVLGAIAVAVIALIGVMAVTGGDDSSEIGQQSPQQQPAPQQAPQQPEAPAAPQAPQGVPQDGASSEQVEGLRADLERQLAEIRASINQLRLEIWSLFTSSQQDRQESQQ